MKESLVLNFQVLKDLNISIDEFLYIYKVHKPELNIKETSVDLVKLQENRFIKIITEDEKKITTLRDKSIKLIKFLTVEIDDTLEEDTIAIKKSVRAINAEVKDNIHKFRNIWKGLKPGAMGGSKSCEIKLMRWRKENPEYTFEDILKAANIYIESLRGDYRFLQKADYFIFKQENNREESSRLSAFIDEIDTDMNADWTSNLN